jgi:hypothetical protein
MRAGARMPEEDPYDHHVRDHEAGDHRARDVVGGPEGHVVREALLEGVGQIGEPSTLKSQVSGTAMLQRLRRASIAATASRPAARSP